MNPKSFADLTPEQRALLEQRLMDGQSIVDKLSNITKRRESENIPLSYSQWRLWFLDQFEPGSPTYNLSAIHRLLGSINTDVLEQAINEIIRRHDALRTIFSIVEDEPVQVIQNSLKIPLQIIEINHHDKDERENQTRELVRSDLQEPFNLSSGPLIRAKLYRLETKDHVLLINTHHIISDAWSLGLFFKELDAIYDAFLRGEPSPLADIDIQYADYAIWQRNILDGDTLDKHLSYWKEQLADAPILEIPTDYPRPRIRKTEGEWQSLELTKEITESLKTICKHENATSFMLLLAAFNILLQRLSGQNDIITGTPIAGRNRIETEKLIGFFLNSLVLRADLSGNPTFSELLKRVQRVALDAFDNQDLPFEKIIEALNPSRDLSRTPFFQIFFNMINVSSEEIKLHDLQVIPFRVGSSESIFDLTVYAREADGRFRFAFAYNKNLFSYSRISAMISQYQSLLEQIAVYPDKEISNYTLINPENQGTIPDPTDILTDEWQGTIHNKVSEHAQVSPDHVAMVDKNGAWSYSELDRISTRLGYQLIQNGVQPQDLVAIYAHRSSELVAAILGIHKAGGAFLILDPAHPPTRLVKYIRLAKPKGIIHLKAAGNLPDEIKLELKETKHGFYIILPEKCGDPSLGLGTDITTPQVNIQVGPNDPACVVFTSGSTGNPKGILGKHGSLSHFIPWQAAKFGLGSSDRFSMLSGLSHDPLQRDIFTSLWLGATLCIPDPDRFGDPGWLAEWMDREQITFVHLTPAMGQYICFSTHTKAVLNSVRYLFFVGDQLTQNDVEILRALVPQATMINSYGSTETQRAVGYFSISPQDEIDLDRHHRIYPIGCGIPNVQLLILNEEQLLCGIGELGEIYVRSPHLALGYLVQNYQSEAHFLINPFTGVENDRLYRTGDLGRYRPDGNVEFSGRIDKQVKLRGYRIELGEIETALIKHPGIKDAVVLARETAESLNRLVAYIIPQSDAITSQQDLRNFLIMTLPDYMLPSIFVPINVFPLTPNGKINLNLLPTPDELLTDLMDSYEPPRTPEEEIISKVWSEILKIDQIGIQDNFYELGGHSLLAIRIVAKLENALGRAVHLSALIQSPTIKGLARSIQDQASSLGSYLIAVQPKGAKPPLFCVPPAASTAMRFEKLANYLGVETPLYGFEYPGMDGKADPFTSIPKMAQAYVQEILIVQSQGPYFLAGMCYGGIVAFEMAQQLLALGHQVAFLGLLDSNYAPRKRKQLSYYAHVIRQYVNRVIFQRENSGVEIIKRRKRRSFDKNDPISKRIQNVFNANLFARLQYSSPPYPGKITKFSTDWVIAKQATKRWKKATSFGLEDHTVPGSHVRRSPDDSGMMDEPNVQVVAKKLKECLEGAYREMKV